MRILRDPQVWLLVAVYFAVMLAVNTLAFWMPTLIHGAGARMVSAGVEMRALLESIDHDWPATRIAGTGWAASPAPGTPRP